MKNKCLSLKIYFFMIVVSLSIICSITVFAKEYSYIPDTDGIENIPAPFTFDCGDTIANNKIAGNYKATFSDKIFKDGTGKIVEKTGITINTSNLSTKIGTGSASKKAIVFKSSVAGTAKLYICIDSNDATKTMSFRTATLRDDTTDAKYDLGSALKTADGSDFPNANNRNTENIEAVSVKLEADQWYAIYSNGSKTYLYGIVLDDGEPSLNITKDSDNVTFNAIINNVNENMPITSITASNGVSSSDIKIIQVDTTEGTPSYYKFTVVFDTEDAANATTITLNYGDGGSVEYKLSEVTA